MNLGELMYLPAEAQLIVGDDGLSLIAVTREHNDRLHIDRYPLGAVGTLETLYKLLDTVGLMPQAVDGTPTLLMPPTPEAPKPVTAKTTTALACPECGAPFARPQGLAIHRRKKHGVIGGTARASEAKPAPTPTAKAAPTHLDQQIEALRLDIKGRRVPGADDDELKADRRTLARLVQRRVEARQAAS